MTGDYNKMCLDCQHFRNVCDGTRTQAWTGCILKDHDTETARDYIDRMDEILADHDTTVETSVLLSEIDRQADEAKRDDLDEDEIIDNRFL